MNKLIPRDAAIAAITLGRTITQNVRALQAIPTIDPAAIREAALREAAKRVTELMTREVKSAVGEGYNLGLGTAYDAILALIGEKK